MRIVFMGSPEFAVESLDILYRNGLDIVGVITAPDRQAGRGRKVRMSAVKAYCVDKGLLVLQPTNLKSPEFLETLAALKADLQVVVAFRMLPESVWDMPPLGTINLHASLLPQYRGAAPINWAIINGEKLTGVTTFFISHEIDTGDLLFQESLAIGPDEDAGELHDRLKVIGAELVLRTVKAIGAGSVQAMPQEPGSQLRKAPKIFRKDCRINFNRTVEEVCNMVRGLSPYPGAFTEFNGRQLKVLSCRPHLHTHQQEPGAIELLENGILCAYAQDGFLELLEVQQEGKRRMSASEFVRGWRAPR